MKKYDTVNGESIARCCDLCENSSETYESEKLLCEIHGIVSREYVCRKYAYDPQKRIPKKPSAPEMPDLSGEDGEKSE